MTVVAIFVAIFVINLLFKSLKTDLNLVSQPYMQLESLNPKAIRHHALCLSTPSPHV